MPDLPQVFAKLAQLSRTAVTRLYHSSGVELITRAGVAVLQSLILCVCERVCMCVCVFICLVGEKEKKKICLILLQMDVTIVYCLIELFLAETSPA